jgi:hypothetical protein
MTDMTRVKLLGWDNFFYTENRPLCFSDTGQIWMIHDNCIDR